MTKTKRLLLVTSLSLGLAAGVSWAAKGGNGNGNGNGGGGNTGGDPSRLGVIGRFLAGPTATGHSLHLVDDGHPDGQYDNTNVDSGWVQLPGTGNFVMSLEGTDRAVVIDFSHALDQPAPGDPGWQELQDFMSNYGPALSNDGLTVRWRCDVVHFNETTGECSDYSASNGSLKELGYGEPDLVMSIRQPLPGGHWIHCGPAQSSYGDWEGDEGTTPLLGRCTAGLGGSTNPEDPCAEWRIAPYKGPGGSETDFNFYRADVEDPENWQGPNIGELRCSLTKHTKFRNTSTVTKLGEFDLRFGLTVLLDADQDGIPANEDADELP